MEANWSTCGICGRDIVWKPMGHGRDVGCYPYKVMFRLDQDGRYRFYCNGNILPGEFDMAGGFEGYPLHGDNCKKPPYIRQVLVSSTGGRV